MKRRDFLVGSTVAGIIAGSHIEHAEARKPVLARRTLKREFINVGMVGLGPYSRAMAYTQAINEPSIPPRTNMRVVAIWGKEDGYSSSFKGSDTFIQQRGESLRNLNNINTFTHILGVDTVVQYPEDMVNLVDAVFITDPDDSLALARPFIEAGKSVFIDCPFAWTMSDAREIIRLAGEKNVSLVSGSHIPWMNEFQAIRTRIDPSQVQQYYCDGLTTDFISSLPHILETAQMLVGGKVMKCSTHGAAWTKEENPLSPPPFMVHLEYNKTQKDRDPIIGVISTWYGLPFQTWVKVHLDSDVIEEGIYLKQDWSVQQDELTLIPFLRVIDRAFETGIAPERSENILDKVAVMLMAHKSGCEKGQPVSVDEIEKHSLPRFITEGGNNKKG